MGNYDGMTVGERLFDAGLLDAYEAAKRGGDLNEINVILEKIGLRQDESGMNWSIDASN